MDRNSVIGFLLIGLVLMVWMWVNSPKPTDPKKIRQDTIQTKRETVVVQEKKPQEQEQKIQTTNDKFGKFFSSAATGRENIITIETELYKAEVTSKGALIRKFEFKKYKSWDQIPVQLVDYNKGGDFSLLFNTTDGKQIDTRDLYFENISNPWGKISLQKDSSYRLTLMLKANGGGLIEKIFVFKSGSYSIDVDVKLLKIDSIISNFEYQVTWENGLRYAEHNSVDESRSAKAYAYSGGELTDIDATSEEVVKNNLSGNTQWVATRNKYFGVAIISKDGKSTGAYLEGAHKKMSNNGMKETYNIALKMPFRSVQDSLFSFILFLGPLEFDVVKSLNVSLDQIMSLGAAWIIRPISEYFMIPLFEFLKSFIPNYGVVIIIFSIIIKLLLYPLTKSSMRSMQKMQQLQPMIEEVKTKYKDDPQKMNQSVMRLYKEYGVNPAGGCLPMLLQLPILYALWAVFSSSIELRQASFMWWIKDLSIPDTIGTLPFAIPIFNIRDVSGLALLMGITMFIQQKMTTKDPRQKMMVWMMPIMLTLLFNFFPAGLNLYYFMFNLLSIGQQMYITKKHKNDPLRKVEQKKKRGGIISKLTQNMPKLNK
jgi:YidC/Oxa1 family membrane protein insertase